MAASKPRSQTSWSLSYNQNGTQSLQPSGKPGGNDERSSYAHPPISPRAGAAQPLQMTSALHNTRVPTTFAKDLLTHESNPNSEHFTAFNLAGIETMLQTMEYNRVQNRKGKKRKGVKKRHNHYASSPFEQDMLIAASKQQSQPIQFGGAAAAAIANQGNNGDSPKWGALSPNANNYGNGNGSNTRAHAVVEAMRLLSNQQQAHRKRKESHVGSGTNVFDMIANGASSLSIATDTEMTNGYNDHVYQFSHDGVLTDADLQMAVNAAASTRHIGTSVGGSSFDGRRFVDPVSWESAIKQIESHGQWIECRTTMTGRVMWYNTNSFRMVFDRPPELEAYIEEIEKNKEKFVANKQNRDLSEMLVNDRPLRYYISRKIEPRADESIVETLLYFKENLWKFDNDLVQVYRGQASRKNHHKMLPPPQQYCFPEYFSDMPLPELAGGKFYAEIRIPNEFSRHRQYAKIMVKADHTRGADAIKQGVKKLDSQEHDAKDFVLKVVGKEEYIFDRKKIIDYEAVRMAVRNENDAEFVLLKIPEKDRMIKEAKAKQKQYEEAFKTAYDEKVREKGFLEYEDRNENDIPKFNEQEMGSQSIISLYELDWPWRLKIGGLTNVTSLPRFNDTLMRTVYVRCEIWMGDMIFDNATLDTTRVEPKSEIRWGQWLMCKNQTFSQLPRESVLCFIVYGVANDGTSHALAWCRLPLIDHRHKLRRGKMLLNLWDIPAFRLEKDGPKTDPYKLLPFRYRGTTRDQCIKNVLPEQCQLLIEFDAFVVEVVAPKYAPAGDGKSTHTTAMAQTRHTGSGAMSELGAPSSNNTGGMGGGIGGIASLVMSAASLGGSKLTAQQLTKQQKHQIEQILERSPLEELKPKEKGLIWMARDLLWHDPKALPAFLRSVNWTNRLHIGEAHKYLNMWSPPKRPEDALEFLDYRFADTTVREKAIRYLEDMQDGQLQQYLLQLVQCLKYEPHHDSALARFLVRRGLKNPYQIGHFLFWHLKAEYHNLKYCERFGVIMEEYLLHAGEHSRQLFIQCMVLKRLEAIARNIFKAKHTQPADVCKKLLKKELHRLNKELPDSIQIPLNPRWRAKKLIVDRCRYMGSKKVPLWLVFENADPYAPPIEILFKSGDDLRQDMLTLQMLNVMDSVWLDSKLDLHLKPYSAIATGINSDGEGVGMLEIVLNSTTINTINVKYGGAFNAQTIDLYLKEQPCNKGNQLTKARDTFARSCAGYCVATFVMGIGDRHSDNIMVSKAGHFFHIDFGHFLGNFKSKFGVRRERSPFVFTPQMKYAIDGGERNSKLYNEGFYEWCHEAYNVLRSRARLLLVLFALMVSAGMPELMMESDILYFQEKLNLGYDIQKARDHLKKLIKNSLSDRARLIDNAIHAAVHSGGSSKSKNSDKYDTAALLEACRIGETDRVKKCLDPSNKSINMININELDDNGFTPLIYASNGGHTKIVDFLIKKANNGMPGLKLDVNLQGTRSCDGMTALIAAAKGNHKTLAKALLTRKDINVQLTDGRGWTALHYVAQHTDSNALSFARHLLKNGASAKVKNRENKTPIDIAKEKECDAMIKCLEGGK